jgi:hypothetical protein
MLLLLEREDFDAAEVEAQRAVEMYPLHDRRFPFFVADYALVQLMQHQYSKAHSLLQLCLDVIDQPAARGVITSMLARTSAGMGRLADYNRFHGWAVESIEKYVEDAAAGHYHLAEAARACHAWRDSEVHATKARELAIRSDDRMITRLAEQLLAQAKARENGTPPAPPPASTADLNRLLSVRLQRWSPEEHRGPPRTAFRNQWVA